MSNVSELDLVGSLNPGMVGSDRGFFVNKRRDRSYIYYRRCTIPECERHTTDKGYIIIGPQTNQHQIAEPYDFQMGKHATPLDVKYIAPEPNSGIHPTDELMNSKTTWVPLLRNGGIREMPIEQMRDLGWHRNKTIASYITELSVFTDIPCDYGCPTVGRDARLFNNMQDYESHVAVMHSEIQAPRTIGKMIADNQGGTSKELVTAFAEAMKQVMKEMRSNS